MERHPGESFEDYKQRRRQERAEFKKHMLGVPVIDFKGNKPTMIINKNRGAKKLLMQKLGVNGKRLRKLMKRERRKKNDS